MKLLNKFLFAFLFIFISLTFVLAFNFNQNIFENKNILRVTGEHPFLINSKWVEAKDLRVGDKLTSVDGKKVRVENIEDIVDEVEVYNLEVENYSDFIVNGLIVHNSNKPTETFSEIKSRLEEGRRTADEQAKIDYANSLLEKDNLPPLNPSQEDPLLLAHYSETGNIDKVWRLGEAGLSDEQIKLLGDNRVFGPVSDIIATPIHDNVNTIAVTGIDYSPQLRKAQLIFSELSNEGKLDVLQKIYPSDSGIMELRQRLRNEPGKDIFQEVTKLEEKFFADKDYWTKNNELTDTVMEDIAETYGRAIMEPKRVVGQSTRGKLYHEHLTPGEFDDFIKTSTDLDTRRLKPSEIVTEVEQKIQSSRLDNGGAKYHYNFVVENPKDAEEIGRSLLRKYVIDSYGEEALVIIKETSYAIEYGIPARRPNGDGYIKSIGTIRRDVAGHDNFPWNYKANGEVVEKVGSVPPHINVEIPLGKIPGTKINTDIQLHVFFQHPTI